MSTQPLQPNATAEEIAGVATHEDFPPGNHSLEIAARRGIGPLSPEGRRIWHGDARPCVTCGQLVPRNAEYCTECDQELDEDTLEKMRAHAGPWFVLEHVRPFPGVNLERVIRQIRRGLITETSIVRGPSTDYQWRFAVETPGLCRYFGKCWNCQERVMPSDTYCRQCLSSLSFERPRPQAVPPGPGVATRVATDGASGAAPTPIAAAGAIAIPIRSVVTPSAAQTDQLRELSAAVGRVERTVYDPDSEEGPRIAGVRATWIAVILMAIVIVVLLFLVESRSEQLPPPTPGIVPFVAP